MILSFKNMPVIANVISTLTISAELQTKIYVQIYRICLNFQFYGNSYKILILQLIWQSLTAL